MQSSTFSIPTGASTRPGHPLPLSVLRSMEKLFSADFSNVTVHTDSPFATSIGARAFAFQDELHFAPGEFRLDTSEGWRVIGHELAHIVQQRLGRTSLAADGRPFILHDTAMEKEAHVAGDVAARFFGEEVVEAGLLNRLPVPSATGASCGVQCLMSVEAFKTASAAAGMRDKIAAVDNELRQYQTLDSAKPRNYTLLLAQIRKLYAACQTYKTQKPGSGRIKGVDQLAREIAMEEVFLVSMSKYSAATDVMDKLEAMEQAQENMLQLQNKPEFTRAGSGTEINDLIMQVKQQARTAKLDDAVIKRDIVELKALLDRDTLPETLKLIIREVTDGKNLNQLDYKIWSPGASFNFANGSQQKYTLKHELEQSRGKKWRLGSLLHELTHISISETFNNTRMMFAIKLSATNKEILALAVARKQKILALKALIASDGSLDPELKKEAVDKANYPICGKIGYYLDNFKKAIGDETYDRFMGLVKKGLDCELIEYDTVINQIALWFALSNVPEGNATYKKLLDLAAEAYVYRSAARLTANPVPLPGTGLKPRFSFTTAKNATRPTGRRDSM